MCYKVKTVMKSGNVLHKHYKTIVVHLALFIGIVLYLVVGAFVFNRLEGADSQSDVNFNITSEQQTESQWDFRKSLLFGFTIVTTIGYGNIAPSTGWGRVFCVLFACAGIPLVMLFIASLGQHVETLLYAVCGRIRRLLVPSQHKDSAEDLSSTAKAVLVVAATFIYISIGSMLMPLYEGDKSPLTAFYFNFITLTTIGLGDVVPNTSDVLPLTLTYILIGLTLTAIAINVASEYLKKLHYVGVKLQNMTSTIIWFGSKPLSVETLVEAVGRHYDIPPEALKQLDIDDMITEELLPPPKNHTHETPAVRTPIWSYAKRQKMNRDALKEAQPLLADKLRDETTPPNHISRHNSISYQLPKPKVEKTERAMMTVRRPLAMAVLERTSFVETLRKESVILDST